MDVHLHLFHSMFIQVLVYFLQKGNILIQGFNALSWRLANIYIEHSTTSLALSHVCTLRLSQKTRAKGGRHLGVNFRIYRTIVALLLDAKHILRTSYCRVLLTMANFCLYLDRAHHHKQKTNNDT